MIQPVGIKTEVAEYIHKTHICLLDVPQKNRTTWNFGKEIYSTYKEYLIFMLILDILIVQYLICYLRHCLHLQVKIT